MRRLYVLIQRWIRLNVIKMNYIYRRNVIMYRIINFYSKNNNNRFPNNLVWFYHFNFRVSRWKKWFPRVKNQCLLLWHITQSPFTKSHFNWTKSIWLYQSEALTRFPVYLHYFRNIVMVYCVLLLPKYLLKMGKI